MRLSLLPLTIVVLSAAPPKAVSIQTRDSLSLRQGTYSSLYFVAEPVRDTETNLPVSYRFTESGQTPPGMIFEAYPCNKPGTEVCPQLASANGIYLDGAPAKTGSYTFVISATGPSGSVSRSFTVIVNPSDQNK